MKLIFFIFSLSFLLWSRGIQAYSFTSDFNKGFYWMSLPINMTRIVVDQSEGSLLEEVVREAEQEWERSVGREIWNVEVDSKNTIPESGNVIRWSYDFAAETGFDPYGTLAVTVRKSVGTYIVKTEIILNGEMNYLRNNENGALKKTILHELGHTVGLGHSQEEAIMGESLSSVSALMLDDEQGMNALLDETSSRQESGYISPEVADEQSNALACGSIDLSKNSSSGPGGLMSLFLGVILSVLLLSGGKKRQILPIRI